MLTCNARQHLLSLITIGALIAVAGFFLMGKILAGTAVITEFLLITGGADTIPTVVMGHRPEYRCREEYLFRFFFHIRFTSPEVTVRFVHSNLLIHF